MGQRSPEEPAKNTITPASTGSPTGPPEPGTREGAGGSPLPRRAPPCHTRTELVQTRTGSPGRKSYTTEEPLWIQYGAAK